jgi:hypothetical protein
LSLLGGDRRRSEKVCTNGAVALTVWICRRNSINNGAQKAFFLGGKARLHHFFSWAHSLTHFLHSTTAKIPVIEPKLISSFFV